MLRVRVCNRVRRPVRGAVLGDGVPEAVPLLLPQVLRGVPVRAAGHLRQQEHLPLLQQLEDQERRAQVPVSREKMAAQYAAGSGGYAGGPPAHRNLPP